MLWKHYGSKLQKKTENVAVEPLKKMCFCFLPPGIVSCNVDGSNCRANWQNGVAAEFASAFGRLDFHDTVDGCEILHHQKDGWNPINHGINHRFQLVQDFATIHSMSWNDMKWLCLEMYGKKQGKNYPKSNGIELPRWGCTQHHTTMATPKI